MSLSTTRRLRGVPAICGRAAASAVARRDLSVVNRPVAGAVVLPLTPSA